MEGETGEWYQLNENEFSAEIKKHGEIVELNITNKPDNPEIDVEKEGIIQTTANQEIKYDFKIQNTGNVPLDNFTWYDFLPTDYVTATKLVTRTYNQDLNYAIYYKTNKNDYRLLRDNLNTQVNNYIDLSNLVDIYTAGNGIEKALLRQIPDGRAARIENNKPVQVVEEVQLRHDDKERRHVHKVGEDAEQEGHFHHRLAAFKAETRHRIRRKDDENCGKDTA